MKIAVCDDEKIFSEMMREVLEQYFRSLDVEIRTFSSGTALLREVKKDPYAYFCIFLDIEMPVLSGIETAEELKKERISVPVILLTSHEEYALRGYEVGAFRFLVKPVNLEKLYHALEAAEKQKVLEQRLIVSQDGREYYLPLNQILYFKSENVYIVIYTETGHYLIRKKLKEQCKELPELQFFQVHRSYIVNMSKVQAYDGKEVVLADGTRVPVGRGRRAAFQKAAARFLKECG